MTDVDTEFDSLRFGNLQPSVSNPGLEKGAYLLAELFNNHNLHATFHIQEQANPNQRISSRYPELLNFIEESGFEIGLHVHIKSTKGDVRNIEISEGVSSLRELGYLIRSFRAGWYLTTTSTIDVLEKNNIEYDCSPVKNSRIGPMRWYDIPNSPYVPSKTNITKVGTSQVLVIPVTDYRLSINYWPNSLPEREIAQKSMVKGIRFLGKLSETAPHPIILYVTTHSWKPISENGTSTRKWVIDRFNLLANTLSEFEYESFTVSEIGDKWRKGGHQPHWYKAPDILGSILPWTSPRKYHNIVRVIVSRFMAVNYYLTGSL